jgi:cis-L-3-hydroxyproline dehydratase
MIVEPSDISLDAQERAMLHGEAGPACQIAMRILCRMTPIYGARCLLPVTRAHLDGVILTGTAGLEFAERLAGLGALVAVPTSLNVMSMDRQQWQRWRQDPEYADRAQRLGRAYLDMGAIPTFTCAPYQTDSAPSFGEQIAWSESNAVAFANSVIGARTNRYGDYLDLCCAITGRVPAAGLHLDEPRLATVAVELDPLPHELTSRDDFYPVLGYLLGESVTDHVPVIVGLDANPTQDQLKSMAAAAASSGAIAIFHIAGVTPEAPTARAALGGRSPTRTLRVTLADLRQARSRLTTAHGSHLDVVAFGSPHCSLEECRSLARMMDGQVASAGVEVFITTSRAVRDLLRRSGELAILEAFGAKVTADTCIVVAPLIKPGAKTLMTNSAKYAHYGPGLLGLESVFASTEDCVDSAVAGRVTVTDGPWSK